MSHSYWHRGLGQVPRLCALPRRTRRALVRQWRRSLSAIALLLALGQAPALAATIAVAPGIPPDISADGRCALIEAIENANADDQTHSDCVAGNRADTIVLPTKSTQSLTSVDNNSALGPTGLPVITSTVTLQGRNSTIQRQSDAPEFRILAVASSGHLTLYSTTVSGGRSVSFPPGGGVYNSGILTLTNSTVSGNSAFSSVNTGGVYNGGTLTLTNSTVSGNSNVVMGGIGGVFNSGTLTLNNSTVSGNVGHISAGGVVNRGTATLTNSTVSGNSGGSGGVSNSGTLTLTNSTVSDNVGEYYGGVRNGGALTLSNSTVSGNRSGFFAAGVDNRNGTLTLARTLISGNNHMGSGGSEVEGGGTIIANNHNLFGHDGNAGVADFTPGPTDLVPSESLGAILKPLADNGGPTKTHALPVGSPAIGQSPANSGCQPTDQRGVTRPQGAACDIGAFEKGPPVLCNGRVVRIIGTVGNDRLTGTPGPDVIHGLAGRDTIKGVEGNDIICGGTGNDELFGASGADALNGGSGIDICNGGSGTDSGASCEKVSGIP